MFNNFPHHLLEILRYAQDDRRGFGSAREISGFPPGYG
jgi:hypothetical protein